jgi:hypothetical protein
MAKINEIISKLSGRHGRKNVKRAIDLIAEHKANAERRRETKSRCELDDLIGNLEPRELTEEDRQWLDGPTVGKEEL